MISLKDRVEGFLDGDWTEVKRLQGLTGGARAYFLSLLTNGAGRPLVVLAPSTKEAEVLYQDLFFFLGENELAAPLEKRLHLYPAWDILPFEKLSPHLELMAARMEGLYHLVEGQSPILVSTPTALVQKVLPKDALRRSILYHGVGEELPRENILEHLAGWGYQNVPLVEERGDFSVRGGILDIFPPAYQHPLRLEFLADRLESVRTFDPSTQRSLCEHQEFLILPVREFFLAPQPDRQVIQAIDARAEELNLPRRERNSLLNALADGIPFAGMESLVPYFYPALDSIFSYLPAETLLWFDGPDPIEEEIERWHKLVREREAKARQEERFYPPAADLYASEEDWRQAVASFPCLQSDPLTLLSAPGEDPASVLTVKSHLNTDLHTEISVRQSKEPSLVPLVNHLKNWQGQRIFLVAPTRAEALRIQGLLDHYEIHVPLLDLSFPQIISTESLDLALVIGNLSQGFRLPDERLLLITVDEILGTKRRARTAKVKRTASHFISSLGELRENDTVVHMDHGVGIYRGLKFLRVAGTEGEFLHLEYHGGDRLYLPIHRINLVQKYMGGDGGHPALDRLGGVTWDKVKAKTRKSILAMAKELLAVYAVREVHDGCAFSTPDQAYREFEASFEFEETPDQQKAIDETLGDMQTCKPMDRLICGDVGYGKTEVALRAAFIAVMDGKQVAVLAPTTILAEQHVQTFRQRFSGYPVRIEILSRFLTPKESRQVLHDLAKGLVDIVIATHRLLQKDVQFKDLGLVVVDEEHRFGVTHKERLKKMRHLVDVISLTATPIPRTLQMSLMGIRDLSIIESPPSGRQAIRTYITRFDDGVVRDAVLREINRGGQVFFLHNRVETIHRMAQKLLDLVPEIGIAVAHGQMPPRELKKVMSDFLENRTQLLVCSAIIESGIDFPNANTIFINRADRFGLAQLYQLRGRVGRSQRRAYAYLLIPGERIMTRDAQKRLHALQEIDELGGGFRVALHDLEIRGAGNFLGEEQSGHIAAVGLELYTQMMEEAVQELKGKTIAPRLEPEIRLGIPAYFPESYIPNTNQRLLFYKRLAGLRKDGELLEIQEELQDRYGACPPVVQNLFKIMELRRALKDNLIEQISFQNGKVSLLFHELSPVSVDRLLKLIRDDGERYRLSPDRRLSFPPAGKGWGNILQEVMALLQSLGKVC